MRKFYVAALAISGVIAAGLSLFASSSPDGLERVAHDLGFIDTATDSAVAGSVLADYSVAGSESPFAASVAGIAGVIATAIVGYGLYLWMRAPKAKSE